MKELDKSANRTWVLVLVSIATFMVALDSMVVSTCLSTIRLSLGASIEDLEWTVNAYILSIAVFLMMAAELGDKIGRRRLFVVGFWVFAALRE
jgi:MFS family permease